MHVKGTITIPNTGTATVPNNRNKKVIFKICAPFTDCISGINNKEIDHAKDVDVVMPMYNSIEYSDDDSKTSGNFGNTIKMNDLYTIMALLLMFLMILIMLHLNINKK